MPKIETPRLILRPFEERDYDDLYEFLSQRREDQFEAYPDITYENGREHLRYRLGSGDFFAMELKESGKVIGNIYYGARDFQAREVGYIVNKNYQRKGYASEALKAVLAQGFDRTQNDAPVVFCSYPLACETCGKHIWKHTQVELPEELVKEAAELIW